MKKIIVIGGGPGGYAAALRAALGGAHVTLIEKDALGGTCLNRGCIPTKTFLAGAEEARAMKKPPDYSVVWRHKNDLVKQLSSGVGFLLKNRNVTVIRGVGSLQGPGLVRVVKEDGRAESLAADAIILASGSRPVKPALFPFCDRRVITSDEALELETLPESLIIVGGGVIGCEFGQFYARMGVAVTIVELAEQLLPLEDKDTAEVLYKSLKRDKVKIITSTKVERVDAAIPGVAGGHPSTPAAGGAQNPPISVLLSNGEMISADCLLISIGREPVLETLNLEGAGVKTANGKIIVDEKMATNVSGIFAVGDIVNTPFLAHVATKEGITAAENALGREASVSYHAVPRCVYTDPEVACVGLTEREAVNRQIPYQTGTFSFAGLGKALVAGKTTGFVKVLADADDRLIGASIVGPHATELLAELTLAVDLGLTARQVGDVIHPHPTLSEALMEALHALHGKSIHSF